MTGGLPPFGPRTVLAIVDAQRVFHERTAWQVPDLADIMPNLCRLAGHRPRQLILTRFLTPGSADESKGMWRAYYRHWPSVTLDNMPAEMLDVVPDLAAYAPPAEVCDKTTYSSFGSGTFAASLLRRGADSLVLAGVETDACVWATALPAIDLGLRVVIASDAVTSASREAHRAVLDVLLPRLRPMVEAATTDAILAAWH
jgi:nicotinamidase-related amidase